MGNVAFLLIVVVGSVVGSLVVWLRQRKPTTFMSSIDQFQREMAALARDPEAEMPEVKRPTKLRPIVPTTRPAGLADKLRTARQFRGDDVVPRGGPAYEAERLVDVDGEF